MNPHFRPRRARTRRSALVFVVLALAASLTSCGREFEPYWRINDFRVMAIKSDPATLRFGETATIEALVSVPSGDADAAGDVLYQWEWCPVRVSAQNQYECPLRAEELLEGLRGEGEEGPGIDPSLFDFDLGTEPVARLFNPLPPDMILDFCQQIQRSLADATDPELAKFLPTFDCTRGYDITIRLVATYEGKEIVTAKRITLWTGDEQLNENPRFERIEIRPEKESDIAKLAARLDWVKPASTPRDEQWVAIPEDAPLEVLAGVPFEVRSLLDHDSVEIWQPPAPIGSGRELLDPEREALVLRWFTTAGSYSDSRRIFNENLNELDEASITTWTLSEERHRDCREQLGGTCEIKLWSVARDGRLGVDWIERSLVVVED